MALHLRIQTTLGGEFTDIDLTTYRVAKLRTVFSYSHPAAMYLDIIAPQHTLPFGIRNFVQFWDDADETQSETNPHFEGFIEEVRPGTETNVVHCVAYDPTRKASSDITIMSLPWDDATTPASGAVPRLVFNSLIDNDDDYAFEREHYATMGNIMATIFDDQFAPLQATNAAGTYAYQTADMDALTYVPQEKVVFESENIRSAMERLLRWEPTCKMLWYPGTREWRFGDITVSPQVTLTLNVFTVGGHGNVLSLELDRSLEGRATAIRIYGPPVLQDEIAQLSDGSLTDISTGSVLLQNNIATCCNVPGLNRWQITDPALRRVARRLQNETLVQYDDYYVAGTDSPALLGYWPATSAGAAGWRVVNDWFLDANKGIIWLAPGNYMFRYNPHPAGGSPNYENPTDIRFIYATYGTPIQVRVPDSGFQGTAYTVANLQIELKLYDEMLAVGYEYNQPVTTDIRRAQFAYLAGRELLQRQDIAYMGGCTLDGLQYDYQRLNRRVNFASVDANGDPLTTGWEAINAIVTDVEYDFNEQLTTLHFSSDQLELCGIDPEVMKRRLRIKALQRIDWMTQNVSVTWRNGTIGDTVTGFSQMIPRMDTTVVERSGHYYIDPQTGLRG